MFIDDPSELLNPLESAWQEYCRDPGALVRRAEERVAEWRIADGEVFAPNHPFYRTLFTDLEWERGWSPRALRWVPSVESDDDRVRHGFDAAGNLAIIWRKAFCIVAVYGDGYYDLVTVFPSETTGTYQLHHPTYNRRQQGTQWGSFTRILVDGDGRIATKIEFKNEGNEPEYLHRSIEFFRWEGGRLTESYRQKFDRGQKIPEYAKDYSPEVKASLYRQINDELRESPTMRERVQYEYAPDGRLTQVERFKVEKDNVGQTIYSYDPSDTIENVSEELVSALTKSIEKQIKLVKDAQPIRRVALVYSPEHAHCGLPTGVLIAGTDDGNINQFDFEAYPHEAPWPLEGRTGKKIDSLLRRLLILVEGSDEYAMVDAPRPYRSVLWQVSRALYDKLAKSKRLAADDFAVFPLDDHSDVDAREDVRESLPPEVAERVVQESSR